MKQSNEMFFFLSIEILLICTLSDVSYFKKTNSHSWIRGSARKGEGVRIYNKSDSSGINATSSKLRGGVKDKKQLLKLSPLHARGTRKTNVFRVGDKKTKLSLLDKRNKGANKMSNAGR